jgi:hypothetical protein
MQESDRILRLSENAARLLDQLVFQRTVTFDWLSQKIGIDKSTLYYFARHDRKTESQSERRRLRPPSEVKLENLTKILSWIEGTDFSLAVFTPEQKSIADLVKASLQLDAPSRPEWLFEAFTLTEEARMEILEHLGGTHLGFRIRGTTKLVQVVGIWISNSSSSNALEWKMWFREGLEPAQEGKLVPEHEKRFREVRGYVSEERGIVTCIGRQSKSSELYTLSIMRPERSNATHNAMYMTYSRHEAISRALLLVRQHDIKSEDEVEISNRIGDYDAADPESRKLLSSWGLEKDVDINVGFSVSDNEFKPLTR